MSHRRQRLFVVAGATAWAVSAWAGPSAKESSAENRQSLGITVYQQGFGLVRDVRDIEIGQGTTALEFRDVASRIEPETVSVKSLTDPASLSVLEQNYRYDLLTGQKLLEKFVGKKVRVYRYSERAGREDGFDAELLSVADGKTVIRLRGEVTSDFPGRFAFSALPENLVAKPTLAWLVESRSARQRLETTYLTRGLDWKADYVLSLDAKATSGDLNGWVTLTNQSGATFKNAELKLVAGEVEHQSQPTRQSGRVVQISEVSYSEAPMREQTFFEYHLYTLERPTDVLENEQKQVTLLEGKGVKVAKKLILNGEQSYYRREVGDAISNLKVYAYIDLQNSRENHLGIPLPKGTVRVYQADPGGARQFLGEDTIDHTPRDERVRVKVGESFDLVGERKQTEFRMLGVCNTESAWEIEIRNHKDTPESVEVDEPAGGDFQILSSSIPAKKRDATTIVFDARVPARGTTKIAYRVRVRWC